MNSLRKSGIALIGGTAYRGLRCTPELRSDVSRVTCLFLKHTHITSFKMPTLLNAGTVKIKNLETNLALQISGFQIIVSDN